MNTRPHRLQSTAISIVQDTEMRFWTPLSDHISSSSEQNSQSLWMKMPDFIKCSTTSIPAVAIHGSWLKPDRACVGYPSEGCKCPWSPCGHCTRAGMGPASRVEPDAPKNNTILFNRWADGASQSYRLAEDIRITMLIAGKTSVRFDGSLRAQWTAWFCEIHCTHVL